MPGFLRVTTGLDVFDSGDSQLVRNMVVNAPAADNYSLTFLVGTGVSLANLTVRGAATTTGVTIPFDFRLAGNFTFTGRPDTGNDTITVSDGAQLNGNVTLNLGGGTNNAQFQGGRVGGNLEVTGGAGDDTVNLGLMGPLTIGGNLTTNLRAGFNQLTGAGANSILVGRNFSYTGGTGDDRVDFDTSGAQLRVIGSATANLGGMTGAIIPPANFWHTADLTVGRNFAVRGALDVHLDGENFIGGSLTVTATPGWTNRLSMGISLAPGANTQSSTINGSLRYNGGDLEDLVTLDHLTVHRNVDLRFGAGPVSIAYLGVSQNATVVVGGR